METMYYVYGSRAVNDSSSGRSMSRLGQLDSLTGLRFFAAFSILFSHACEWLPRFKDTDFLPRYGSIPSLYGMPLFFVLSGFVIHYNYGRLFSRMSFRWAALEFFGARFARLYPLLVICFSVGLIVDCTYMWLGQYTWWWVELVGGFLTMTQSWFYVVIFGDRLLMANAYGLAWSVSTEFFFYIMYMGLVFLFLQLRSFRAAVFAWVIFAIAAFAWFLEAKIHLNSFAALASRHIDPFFSVEQNWPSSFVRWFFYYSPYSRIFEFIIGCLTAEIYNKVSNRVITPVERKWAAFSLWTAITVLILIGVFYLLRRFVMLHDYVQFLSLNFLCATPIAVLIFCVSRYDTFVSRMLCAAPLVALGELSYSIYSVHTWTLRIFIRDPVNYSNYGGIDAVVRVCLGVGLTLVLSYATYRLIEMPGRKLLRRFFARQLVATFGLQIANLRIRTLGLGSCVTAIASLMVFLVLCLACQLRL